MASYTLTASSAPSLLKRLASLDLSKPWVLTVERLRSTRTVPANNRYWKLTTMAAEESGYTKEELHLVNCGDYFGWEEGELFGKRVRKPKRTTTTPNTLDSKAFKEFSDWAEQRYIDHLGVFLD